MTKEERRTRNVLILELYNNLLKLHITKGEILRRLQTTFNLKQHGIYRVLTSMGCDMKEKSQKFEIVAEWEKLACGMTKSKATETICNKYNIGKTRLYELKQERDNTQACRKASHDKMCSTKQTNTNVRNLHIAEIFALGFEKGISCEETTNYICDVYDLSKKQVDKIRCGLKDYISNKIDILHEQNTALRKWNEYINKMKAEDEKRIEAECSELRRKYGSKWYEIGLFKDSELANYEICRLDRVKRIKKTGMSSKSLEWKDKAFMKRFNANEQELKSMGKL